MGYNTLDLRFAREDARIVADALRLRGHHVTLAEASDGTSAAKPALIDLLDRFLDSCGSSDTVLVYFSGHAFAPKGELLLLVSDDLKNINASSLKLTYLTSALESCGARNKLLILDCCNALADLSNWRPPQSEAYRLLTASGRLEQAKEIDSYGASFMTYHIVRALTDEYSALLGNDDAITVNTLFSWLVLKAAAHNGRGADQVPVPKLMGNQGADFNLTIDSSPRLDRRLMEYVRQLRYCLSDCASVGSSNRFPWCRAVVEIGSLESRYVVPRVKRADHRGSIVEAGLEDLLCAWLADETRLHLAILGDSGMGKSSACIFLSDILLKRLADASDKPVVPVYLSLDILVRKGLLGADIASILRTLPIVGMTDREVDDLLRLGRFVFILDGFDEIADRADHGRIIRNLRHLDPFLTSRCKVILTCRTHFFVTNDQMEQVLAGRTGYGTELYAAFRQTSPEFLIVELQEFSEHEIREVIDKAEEIDANDAWSTIQRLYNLQDLAKRPLLLHLILQTLASLSSSSDQVNRASIYEAYAGYWFHREMARVDSAVDAEKKSLFVEHLAVEMWANHVTSLAYVELQQRVRVEYAHDILALADFYSKDYDTRTSSFLNRDGDGTYKFMHRSFLEFFAARFLVRQLSQDLHSLSYWDIRWFDREVARFIAEILEAGHAVRAMQRLVEFSLMAEGRVLVWNLLHVLSLLNERQFLESVGNSVLARLISRAEREQEAVILRQYCRIIAKFGDRQAAERLIEKILGIVRADPVQNVDNNETYVNYYYGRESACSALLAHLAAAEAKYDRRLHVYVLGQLGDRNHAQLLEEVVSKWTDRGNVLLAQAAISNMRLN